jgi:hypothetical protein
MSSVSTLVYGNFHSEFLSPSQLARMETQMVDCEPHRGVKLIRCIDTRLLANLLSILITQSA